VNLKRKKNTHGNNSTDVEDEKAHSKLFMYLNLKYVKRFNYWWLGWHSFTRSIFRVKAAAQTLIILSGMLAVLYVVAAFYSGKGEFVISLDPPMADEGFQLSETADFGNPSIQLVGYAIASADNINIKDISKSVMDVDGSHNDNNCVIYTYYVKNQTIENKTYQYSLKIQSASNGVEDAAWVMVFQNEKQNIYAKENINNHPECQYSQFDYPFTEYAENRNEQVQILSDDNPGYIMSDDIKRREFKTINGVYQLQAIPFFSEDTVCSRERLDIKPGEVDKYTVIVWLEGEDPDCVDSILGGHIELSMKLSY